DKTDALVALAAEYADSRGCAAFVERAGRGKFICYGSDTEIAQRLQAEPAEPSEAAPALDAMFPGIREGRFSLTPPPENDRQWCIEHGMFHSVEMRSATCVFEGEEEVTAEALAAPAEGGQEECK